MERQVSGALPIATITSARSAHAVREYRPLCSPYFAPSTALPGREAGSGFPRSLGRRRGAQAALGYRGRDEGPGSTKGPPGEKGGSPAVRRGLPRAGENAAPGILTAAGNHRPPRDGLSPPSDSVGQKSMD